MFVSEECRPCLEICGMKFEIRFTHSVEGVLLWNCVEMDVFFIFVDHLSL